VKADARHICPNRSRLIRTRADIVPPRRGLHDRDGIQSEEVSRSAVITNVTTDRCQKWLKDDDDLRNIPVIAITAFAMKGDEERIREGGCEAYFHQNQVWVVRAREFNRLDTVGGLEGRVAMRLQQIAITAFAMKGDEERIREGGCEAYLSKPISVAKFLATVRRYIGDDGAP
jgi:CheY-like chemotaxis protein